MSNCKYTYSPIVPLPAEYTQHFRIQQHASREGILIVIGECSVQARSMVILEQKARALPIHMLREAAALREWDDSVLCMARFVLQACDSRNPMRTCAMVAEFEVL